MYSSRAPKIASARSSCLRRAVNSGYHRRRFFKPLLYLCGTASICNLFIFALVTNNESLKSHQIHQRVPSGVSSLLSLLGVDSYSYPWNEDEQCKSFGVQFAKQGTFQPRALVSFPGSGNSWLRYLIERSSGYFTGSVYEDKKLFKSGLLGELRSPTDGTTILQKAHHDNDGVVKFKPVFGYRGVLIIRNPYDALLSFWNFRYTKNKNKHTGIIRKSEFNYKKWANFVRKEIPGWTSLIMSWIENSQDYLIVLYEDVQKDPREELIRILGYLNQPVNTARLDCLMKPEHLEGPFHRPSSPPSPSSSLSLSQSQTISSTPSSNNSSILRLDLVIQDNIDKVNRFFQQKRIPLQLVYTLRPSITSYYFLPNN